MLKLSLPFERERSRKEPEKREHRRNLAVVDAKGEIWGSWTEKAKEVAYKQYGQKEVDRERMTVDRKAYSQGYDWSWNRW